MFRFPNILGFPESLSRLGEFDELRLDMVFSGLSPPYVKALTVTDDLGYKEPLL